MAMTAHDGMARAISPIHLYTDGDVAFALATGEREVPEVRRDGGHIRPTDTRPGQLGLVFAAAADCVTRAIVHAVLAATSAGGLSSYADRFPSAFRHPTRRFSWPGGGGGGRRGDRRSRRGR